MPSPVPNPNRRQLLAAGVTTPLTLTAVTASHLNAATRAPTQSKPDYTLAISHQTIAPLGKPTKATLVNESYPGTSIRYTEGDMFRVLVKNQLNVPTTVHWHGLLVPCYMDGVPGVSQMPIPAGESVLYEYPLRQSGTYWYHSHYQFQEQTGLSGPLIIQPREEQHAYDHDIVVFLTDWLHQSPEGLIPQMRKEKPETTAVQPIKGVGFPFPGNKPFTVDVNYPGYLLNGRSSTKPWTLKVRRGDRIRLRFINGSTATFFQVALADHALKLIAADGQAIEPLDVDNLVIATAERYDALVTVRESGSFTLHAAALGTTRQVVGAIHTADSPAKVDSSKPSFTGTSGGAANYAALRAAFPTELPKGPVRTINVELGGDMKRYLWSMSGQYYPEIFAPDGKAEPYLVRQGERVRIRFRNSTKMYHPMHLHGHFFRLLGKPGAWDTPRAPLKDTVAIGPKQEIDIEFGADNPGQWFFHCHNLFHLAAGMARQVRYRA